MPEASIDIAYCARSSMDRMKDSGSFDAGSTPAGRTKFIII